MSSIKYIEDGTITTPIGFKATGLHAGIKNEGLDLGVIYSEVPANAASVYTTNYVQAEPLHVTKESLAVENKLQAIIVNSGNANACTGAVGRKNALTMRENTASRLSLPNHLIAVASTGVIGVQLPMEQLNHGIQQVELSNSRQAAKNFEKAILTTDTCTKTTCYKVNIAGKEITISGVAKGSGMIEPNMATMLGFITTDAHVCTSALQDALKLVTDHSFNCITVDGDTSTNDTVMMLANGLAKNDELSPSHPDWNTFIEALKKVAVDLAKMIARDGEGATKLVEVLVKGAHSEKEAIQVGKSVVGSSLVKTAMYGNDANWGRILAAVGYSGVPVNPKMIDTFIGDIQVLRDGHPLEFNENEAKSYLQNDTVQIAIDLKQGNAAHRAWGCDLTYDYVEINASYRT